MGTLTAEFTRKYSSGTYTPTIKVKVTVNETYDEATNTSLVELTAINIYSSIFFGEVPVHGKITLNGTVVANCKGGTAYTVNASSAYSRVAYAGSYGSVTVPHNEDGSGSVVIGVAISDSMPNQKIFGIRYTEPGAYYFYGVTAPQSKTVALPSHPRASTIASSSASVATQGTYSLAMNRMAETNHHIATFSYNGTTLYTSASFDTSLSFTVPRTWFANYASLDTLPVTVSVQTYNSEDTAIGDPATASLTVTADADMKPVVSTGWAALSPFNVGAVVGITGYVKGYSQAEATFDSTKITSAVGASIASYSVACQGTTKDTSPYLTPVLVYTSVSVVCTVTDTTASETFTLSVMDYAKPTLTGITISRCTDQGVADEDGDHYSAKATLTYSSLGGQNSAAMSCAAAAAGGSYGPEESMTSAAAHISAAQLSADASYTVRITATDALGNSAVFFQVLPTRKWAMKFRPDGNGVAFGKAAEHSGVFEVTEDWSVRFGSPLPIASGGTGADNAADARANLGIVSGGVTPVTEGGTGADNAVDARCNLGLGSVATEDVLPIAKGGTGGNTVADALANLGFESGTAANGSYCKLPDGTLLQWTKLSISAGAGATGNAVWTFPVPFAGTDYAVTTTAAVGTQANTRSRTMASGYNTTGITVYWRNESSSSYTMNVACLAVGRWK